MNPDTFPSFGKKCLGEENPESEVLEEITAGMMEGMDFPLLEIVFEPQP